MPQIRNSDEPHRQHHYVSSNRDHNAGSSRRSSSVKRTTLGRRHVSTERKKARNSSPSMKKSTTGKEEGTRHQHQKRDNDSKRVTESSSTRQSKAIKRAAPSSSGGDECRPKQRRCSPPPKDMERVSKPLRLKADHGERKGDNNSTEGKNLGNRSRHVNGSTGRVSSPLKKENRDQQIRKEKALPSVNDKNDDSIVNSFANQGFSSTTPRDRTDVSRKAHKQDDNKISSGKPRILPPAISSRATDFARHKTGNQLIVSRNVIVNELSEGSIKREEHPMKGFAKLANRSNRGNAFVSRRGKSFEDGAGTFVGVTNQQQQRGIGQRDATNASSKYNWSTGEKRGVVANENKQNSAGFTNFVSHNHRQPIYSNNSIESSTIAAPGKAVQSSVVIVGGNAATGGGLQNPLSVPRGRNYFLHDARDDDPTAQVPTHKNSATTTAHKLYDPRIDRGRMHGVSTGSGFKRGGGRPTGDRYAIFSDYSHKTHNREATAENESTQQQPPLGWRNQNQFGVETNDQLRRFSGTFYGRNDNGRAVTASIGTFRRSKADEDRVWSHDKFFEAEQAETKLELVDELSTCTSTAPTKSSEFKNPLTDNNDHHRTEILPVSNISSLEAAAGTHSIEMKPIINESATAASSSLFEEEDELLYD